MHCDPNPYVIHMWKGELHVRVRSDQSTVDGPCSASRTAERMVCPAALGAQRLHRRVLAILYAVMPMPQHAFGFLYPGFAISGVQYHDPTHYITHRWNTSRLSTRARDAVAWKSTVPSTAANANNHLAMNPPEQLSVHAAAAIFTHCPVSMDIIISTFITSNRSRPNRYSRMQVFR